MHSARSTWAARHGGADLGDAAGELGKGQVAVGVDEHRTSRRQSPRLRRAPAAARLRWSASGGRRDRGARAISSIRSLQRARLLVGREADADALRAVARGVGRRDPGDLAGHRVALRVVGQRQQHVDVVAELVVARRRDEDAAFGEQRDVGRVERALFLDGQLDDARPRRRAGAAGGRGGAAGRCRSSGECTDALAASGCRRGVCNASRPCSQALSSIRPALNGCSACCGDARAARATSAAAPASVGAARQVAARRRSAARRRAPTPAASWQSFCSASTDARQRPAAQARRVAARARGSGSARQAAASMPRARQRAARPAAGRRRPRSSTAGVARRPARASQAARLVGSAAAAA